MFPRLRPRCLLSLYIHCRGPFEPYWWGDKGPQARRRALDDEFPVEATLLEEAEGQVQGQAVEKVRLRSRSQSPLNWLLP